jgi:hypothetical protein
MPRWLLRILATVHQQATTGRIRLTAKARRELDTMGAGLDGNDVREILLGLNTRDFAGRLVSREAQEWMYVFKPKLAGETLYLKLILRGECVVVSIHEDEARAPNQSQE